MVEYISVISNRCVGCPVMYLCVEADKHRQKRGLSGITYKSKECNECYEKITMKE